MKRMKSVKDLTGQKFGMLTVVGVAPDKKGKTYWVCQCECGNVKTVRSDSLQIGAIKSCGCLKKKQNQVNLSKNHSHKMSGTRIYQIWASMKKRCNNKNDPRYHRYGGRGIKVCPEWESSFELFFQWAIANGYEENLTIDRIDNDLGYSPDNCRWACNKEQCNNRSTNIRITIGNATKTLTEWCELFELDCKTVLARYNRSGYVSINQLFNGENELKGG